MSIEAARQIADAVLYEGYLLYPYRASAQKNRSRWQFGVVMPAGYADDSEPSYTRAECVLEGGRDVTVLLRFLQVQRRTGDGSTWDEAVEREIRFTATDLPYQHAFTVDGGTDRDGGVLRRRTPLRGVVSVAAEPLPGPWRARRLRVRVDNTTPVPGPGDRASALTAAFVAAHTVLSVSGGGFVSMVEPPEWAADAVAGCVNVGTWPVLVGSPGERDVLLCAPIILYDYPEIAPESPGDLFDGTEIDEILTLRTLALTDEEKRQARATDPRAAALLDRTEGLDPEALRGLHGTIRMLRPAAGGGVPVADDGPTPPWWDPEAAVATSGSVLVAGRAVGPGSRVRLQPGARRADAQDMFLVGRVAVVEAVLTDVDDQPYLAVTLADDPGADVERAHGRFRYFGPDEVEPCDD